jgi:hypothetical protein
MRRGGSEQMWQLVSQNLAQQRRQELTAAGLAFGLPVVIGVEASFFALAFGAGAASALFLLPAAACGWYTCGKMRRWNRTVRDHVGLLKLHIHRNLFDYDLWRDLIENDSEQSVRLGAVTVSTVPVSFGKRLSDLFENYEQLCRRKKLRPFNAEYKAFVNDPKYSREVAAALWKYALAEILNEEFCDRHRRRRQEIAARKELTQL